MKRDHKNFFSEIFTVCEADACPEYFVMCYKLQCDGERRGVEF